MFYYSLLIIIAVLSTASVVSTKSLLYVLPAGDDSTECPVSNIQQCLTLSQLQSSVLVESNTVLNIVAGVHSLQSVLSFTDLENLTIVGSSGSEFEPTIISCNPNSTSDSGLILMNITTFVMRDIVINGCHVWRTQEQLMLSKYAKTFLNFSLPVQFGVFLNYLYDVELINVRVHNCTGYGMLAFNLLGDSYARNLDFFDNNRIAIENSSCFDNVGLACKGGNLVLVYTDLLDCPVNPLNYSITIADSSFTNGVDAGVAYVNYITPIYRNDLQFIAGAGIGLHMMQSSYGLNALIENCTMEDNAAYTGANTYLSVWDFVDNSTLVLKNSTFKNGISPREIFEALNLAMGLYYDYGHLPIGEYSPVCEADQKYETKLFSMEECVVAGNEATLASGGFIRVLPKSFIDHSRVLKLTKVRFVDNNGDATLVLFGQGISELSAIKMYLIECEFIGNFYRRMFNSVYGSSNHQVIYQISNSYTKYINCTWKNNQVSSLHAIQSRIVLSGENRFIDNTAIYGAGLSIQEGSEVYLEGNSVTIFIGNHAEEFGGAIYAAMLAYRCFYQLDTAKEPLPVLYFSNNTAVRAGEAVYGSLLFCLAGQELYAESSYDTFLRISYFKEESIVAFDQNSSVISARPNGLCLCFENLLDCNNSTHSTYSTYPGKKFEVEIQAFGYFTSLGIASGQTPADVAALIVDTHGNVSATFKDYTIQSIEKGCNTISYTIVGYEHEMVWISLSPTTDRLYFPVYIRVHLEPCPTGFVFSSTELNCKCTPLFLSNSISCSIENDEFQKGKTQWIGYINGTKDKKTVAVGLCKMVEYCNRTDTTVTVSQLTQDSQCINNHAGIVCGKCKPDYSLTLGSAKCLKCSNKYLLLFIFFASGGLFWITFLTFFDVTVDTGRINGMLFYANVIRIVNFEFFRTGESANAGFYIFQVIVNWINLDFGIVSCFYNGFDYYAKCWFNFVFPFYLLGHIFIIGFCANKSSRFSRILPKNILPVLTTLALICFTKLLRSSVLPMPFQTIQTGEGSLTVWQFDGSVTYFSAKHAILLLFGLVILLLLVIPFTFIMFFYPSLQSFTGHEETVFEKFICFFRSKITKFKPLLDTYDGPYLNKHRYYTGLLLAIRLIIMLIAASTFTDTITSWFKPASISIICIVLLIMVAFLKIYLCPINAVVEFLYLVNLTILEFVLLIMHLSKASVKSQGIAISISIAVSFLIFITVLIYEKYLLIEPVIYKRLGKQYRPRSAVIANSRMAEDEENDKTVGDEDQDLQIFYLIDEDRKEKERLSGAIFNQSKEEELIQQLIKKK